eukprot:2382787-Alexandrium_andersonii.AAC.1
MLETPLQELSDVLPVLHGAEELLVVLARVDDRLNQVVNLASALGPTGLPRQVGQAALARSGHRAKEDWVRE